ncbi:MAG: SMC-Scp complex subunit ScpB [Candidatus Korobacteraceae bacterium]|jgi:segregation and condensation protein B
MSLKAKVEAIIYAAEEPITLEQLSLLLKETVLADLAAAEENAAIERADAACIADADGAEFSSEESALLPELAIDSAESVCPELGPLMPQEVAAAPEEANAAEPAAEEPAVASVNAPEVSSRKRKPQKTELEIAEDKAVRECIREILAELVNEYAREERGIEIRQVAGGFRMATKPEHHDVVRAFAKSLKPPIRLSLAALETLAVIAYKQPVTGPEIADIRGVESVSVLGTLLDRKLITTAGRKQVIGRPMQYKTSKDFLLRFGLNDVNELPSMEEFSQLASEGTVEIVPTEPQQTLSLFEPGAKAATEAAEDITELEATRAAEAEGLRITQPSAVELEKLEAHLPGSQLPEAQEIKRQEPGDATEVTDSRPRSDADSGNVSDAEHPVGR